jgi:hypothetical protein
MRKLGGGERIFLSLSYGRVVDFRPIPTWSMIVIRHYEENKLSSLTHHFGLIMDIMKVGGKLLGGLLQFGIRVRFGFHGGFRREDCESSVGNIEGRPRYCTTWNPTSSGGDSSIYSTLAKRNSFSYTIYLKGGGVKCNIFSKEVCSWRRCYLNHLKEYPV